MPARRVGAVDIGSNAARLLICDAKKKAEGGGGGIERVMAVRIPLRLGGPVFRDGRIGGPAGARLLDCMRGFRRLADSQETSALRGCATAAMREAADGAAWAARAATALGGDIRVIDGREEARLLARSVSATERKDDATGGGGGGRTFGGCRRRQRGRLRVPGRRGFGGGIVHPGRGAGAGRGDSEVGMGAFSKMDGRDGEAVWRRGADGLRRKHSAPGKNIGRGPGRDSRVGGAARRVVADDSGGARGASRLAPGPGGCDCSGGGNLLRRTARVGAFGPAHPPQRRPDRRNDSGNGGGGGGRS